VTNARIEAEGMATHGVLTRTVADTAAALDVLACHDAGAWWSPPSPTQSFLAAIDADAPSGLRVGVLTDAPIDGIPVDAACLAAVDSTVTALETSGHHVLDASLPLPQTSELVPLFTTIWNVGGAGIPLADPDRVEPHNRALREASRSVDSWRYVEAVQQTQELSRRIVTDFMDRFDLLVTPTMACLPPPVGFWRTAGDDPLAPLLASYPLAVFTSLFNVTGQPAISLPVHHDDTTGMPVGVQLVAAPWREDVLLHVSRSLERSRPWSDRRAPVA
jgi:amidase